MDNRKIEWTDHTFNPWIGCAKVSPGCAHCYAESVWIEIRDSDSKRKTHLKRRRNSGKSIKENKSTL